MNRTPEHRLVVSHDDAMRYQSSQIMLASHMAFMETLNMLIKNRYFRVSEHFRILDIACGTGQLTCRIAKRFSGAQVVGVDASLPMVRIAQRNAQECNSPHRPEFGVASVEDLGDWRSRYDLILCNGSMHHFSDPNAFWDCVHKVSARDGYLIAQDLRRPTAWYEARQIVYDATRPFERPDPLQGAFLDSLAAAYTTEEIREQLSFCKLDSLTVEDFGPHRLRVFGYVNPCLKQTQ